MFRKILKFLKQRYHSIIQSIAFYPILISLAFLLLAIGSIQIENLELIGTIKKKIPYLFIEDYETSRAILSTVIGGIISLTVFSFSMVMVVLNQASSNFSPRLLPDLISNKKHQIILGFYIGTLLYCIITLTALGAYGVDSDSLGLSTMLAALASLVCIGLFVYFINSISVAIQIHNIIDKIYDSTDKYLDKELKSNRKNKVVDNTLNSDDWMTIQIDKTGYYRGFDVSLMKDSIKDKENHIILLPYINEHIWEGEPVLKIKEFVSKEELDNLLFCFDISTDRHESDKNVTGMIKLMEIAVKAMSPGVNDPGTAINAINKTGQLLNKFLEFPDKVSKLEADNKLTITNYTITAKELMRILIQPIRLYSKHDNSVIYVLLKSLQFIKDNPNISHQNKAVVIIELEALRVDIEKNIDNPFDKKSLMDLFEG
ncbi:DUF2254 domain-containing protein [Brumimicrobium glaciale]|uniref:DUF2254 domain-containing protein n=1 Tax=Brumimicrobium glaciale TaxID=200475 RepID=A0A4Q4KE40_9FLAO|nr:DUF2254 domain-containing protein [Brumimicrobium glaciale]RYM31322.1 DUF2254 domain-containing protein [Brumimicrobium glaciale]